LDRSKFSFGKQFHLYWYFKAHSPSLPQWVFRGRCC